MNKDIAPYNDKGHPNGYWERYWTIDNTLMYKCYFINGERVGYEEDYTLSKNKIQLRFHL